MLKLYLYKKVSNNSDKVFTHYGSNDGQNFWDTCLQKTSGTETTFIDALKNQTYYEEEGDVNHDSPIEMYLDQFTDYDGVEMPRTRFQRDVIAAIVVDLRAEDFYDAPVLFFKMVEYKDDGVTQIDVPIYYYSQGITSASDQNQPTTSYRVECPIDSWATYGSYFHSFMKDYEDETFDFLHKMSDKVIFYKDSITDDNLMKLNKDCSLKTAGTYTGTLDYILQPYLSRTQDYPCNLYANDTGDALSMDTGLQMNGSSQSIFNDGLNTTKMAYINCNTPYNSYSKQSTTSTMYENQQVAELGSQVFADSKFNSNGKYRYLITKFGSNTVGGFSIDENDETKKTAYQKAVEAVKDYPDILMMLSYTSTGNGKQMITCKKVDTYKSSETDKHVTYFNGESLAIIPFPKGRDEELYLFYLNSHDKGIVLGNGAMLGMAINDIPPIILASALRKYNEKIVTGTQQTIGDKVSNHANCPYDLCAMKLDGNFDGDNHSHTFTAITSLKDTSGVEGKTRATEAVGGSAARPKHLTDMSEGYFIIGAVTTHNMNESDTGGDEHFTEKIPDENFGTKGKPFEKTPQYGYVLYMHFKGGDTGVSDNGEFCGVSRMKDDSGGTGGILKTDTIDLTSQDKELKTGFYYAGSVMIPPFSSVVNQGYIKTTNIYVGYKNESSSQFFPTIFHDFSNIPVTICNKENVLNCGSDFFQFYYHAMNEKEYMMSNTKETHPLFYSPGLYNGAYYVDGNSIVTLTGDKLDMTKFRSTADTGNIYLNVAFNNKTNYMLDIREIKNSKYPMTKSGMEFIVQDKSMYPFTSEAFNDGYAKNLTAYDMAKGAKDISNDYAMKNAGLGGLQVGTGLFGGAATGAKKGGGIGAAIGAGTGLISGVLGGIGEGESTKLSIKEANEQFNNEGSHRLQGVAGQLPSTPTDGFSTGSLIYSPSAKHTENSFELFRTYSAPELTKKQIGYDISLNGEQFLSQAYYLEYNNRLNFNIIQCNMIPKLYYVTNYLKQKMFKISPMLSQDTFIQSFISKCADAKSVMRLFKCEYSDENMKQIISDNIELKGQGI